MSTVWNLASENHLETEWASGGREINRTGVHHFQLCVGQAFRSITEILTLYMSDKRNRNAPENTYATIATQQPH